MGKQSPGRAPGRRPGEPKAFGSPRPFRAKPKPEGYVFGRPTLYKPEYCEQVIRLMGEGYDLTAFAGTIPVGRTTVYQWIDAHPDFADAVTKAQSCRLLALQRKLLTTQIGVGVTASIFALKNADPENWQDRYNTTTDVNVRIEHVSDDQLLAIASRAQQPLTIEHEQAPKQLENATR